MYLKESWARGSKFVNLFNSLKKGRETIQTTQTALEEYSTPQWTERHFTTVQCKNLKSIGFGITK